jgi:hypothetical protein
MQQVHLQHDLSTNETSLMLEEMQSDMHNENQVTKAIVNRMGAQLAGKRGGIGWTSGTKFKKNASGSSELKSLLAQQDSMVNQIQSLRKQLAGAAEAAQSAHATGVAEGKDATIALRKEHKRLQAVAKKQHEAAIEHMQASIKEAAAKGEDASPALRKEHKRLQAAAKKQYEAAMQASMKQAAVNETRLEHANSMLKRQISAEQDAQALAVSELQAKMAVQVAQLKGEVKSSNEKAQATISRLQSVEASRNEEATAIRQQVLAEVAAKLTDEIRQQVLAEVASKLTGEHERAMEAEREGHATALGAMRERVAQQERELAAMARRLVAHEASAGEPSVGETRLTAGDATQTEASRVAPTFRTVPSFHPRDAGHQPVPAIARQLEVLKMPAPAPTSPAGSATSDDEWHDAASSTPAPIGGAHENAHGFEQGRVGVGAVCSEAENVAALAREYSTTAARAAIAGIWAKQAAAVKHAPQHHQELWRQKQHYTPKATKTPERKPATSHLAVSPPLSVPSSPYIRNRR